MRILYDHKIFELQQYGGVSRYFCEIVSTFPSDIISQISVLYSNNYYLSQKRLVNISPIRNYREEFLKGIEFRGKGRLFNLIKSLNKYKYPDPYRTNQKYTESLLKGKNFDLFHPTLYDPYFLDHLDNKPFVITIHDMIHELYPEFIHKDDLSAFWKKRLVEKASHIIAVSQNTKNDIIRILQVPEEKITVVHHGAPPGRRLAGTGSSKSYILYVGERHGYKNFLFFVTAVASVLKSYNLKLVCTGPSFNEIEKRLFRESGIQNNVIHFSPDDIELEKLYSDAAAFVYPSLYEGFGLPILEAFRFECPVLLSRTPVFEEVAGKAALYFNPKSIDEISLQLRRIISEKDTRQKLVELGREQIKLFSWTESAQKTLEVYNKVLQ